MIPPRFASAPQPSGQLGTIRRLLGEWPIGPRVRRYQGVAFIACMLVAALRHRSARLADAPSWSTTPPLVSRDLSVMWFVAGVACHVGYLRLADYRQTVLLAVMGNDVVVDLQRRLFDKVPTRWVVDDLARAHSAKLWIVRLITHANAARNVMILAYRPAPGAICWRSILLVGAG